MADKTQKQKIDNSKSVKKPFNKKKWREEKYSMKVKVQRWQEKRKTILKKKLDKELAKEGKVNNFGNSHGARGSEPSRLKRAQAEYERKKEEEREAAEEARKIREEKKQKIKEYRVKKAERFRKLSQKTRKGQPLMKGRLELLQEKIVELIAKDKL